MSNVEVKLTANQTRALTAWLDTCEDFGVLTFRAIHVRSGLEPRLVRRTVRAMARKGITEYVRGCWTDDGDMAGSGYALTPAGRKALAEAGEPNRKAPAEGETP